MHRHGRENVVNKSESLAAREEGSFPSGQLFHQSVHEREERRGVNLADRER